MRKTASGLCLALVCAGLASCSKGGANACSVTPNGKFGSPVTVTVDCPKGAGRLTRETVLEGKGNRIVDGQTVLMRATSFDSRNGEIIKAYNTGELRLAAVTKKGMGDLAKRLVGVREGSRLVIKRPGLVEGVPTASEIIVVDLLFTVAHGKAVPVPNPAPSGMPQVGTADGGGPSIKSPGGAIPSLETVPLVVGNGPQVTEGQTLAVQYALFDQNGKSVDETWTKGAPVALNLKTAMKGLSEGLVDQKIGSRVVVLVPSAKAQGTGDRVVVVDILGALPDPPEGKGSPSAGGKRGRKGETASPGQTPSQTSSPSGAATPSKPPAAKTAPTKSTPTGGKGGGRGPGAKRSS
ncbi:MAG: hypothetical protein D8B44_00730 [Actinomyces sp.]|jgi:peptidyl-prolyl cis-trans isomerase|nr:MAG: hypothetical protein D8B44_00730 [Actinomyces sp.]